ncbi:LysR substrate-binding domain-containing protein [Pseudogulbenkiania subflava]|uniref:DNA-binding transcriptional regulator, LysR family n=1 Tax=Pseudogulbenkiania subflava DSM 22618 TaxID=1123014 RepID=A0A1Y6CDF0_9NEIS|nr:LysR substrate-binding domain-containing protein [Pseudogulbenkiania subflava]SMF49316.1 DNA-binding transcriptional regulator, LysR family [Pseudogulbenkiania subflava DSM 22618]
MTNPMLDPVLLKSFVAVVESGSFTRAGERVHLSQSTVSQHLRRLEEQLGSELLDRSGRYVVTTESGARLLGYARRLLALMEDAVEELREGQVQGEIHIGVPEDFAGDLLTPLLGAFAREYPAIRLEVTSGLSNTLWQQFCAGSYDLVLVKQRQGHTVGTAAWPEPLAWFDSLDTPTGQRDPLPLVVFPAGGLYRDEMIHALESGGRRWRISYCSASLASIRSAVASGLGVSLLPARLALSGHRCLGEQEGFPPLSPLELVLHRRPDVPQRVLDLADRLQAACDEVMG